MPLYLRQCCKHFLRQCKIMCYIVLAFLLPSLIGYTTYYYAGTFGKAEMAPYHKFNGENAAYYVKKLTETGPRIVGTFENEYETVRLIFKIIENMSANRSPAAASERRNTLTSNLQTASGCFVMGKRLYGKLSCYRNINNVVAMVHPVSGPRNESILVNCHFDSVPTSPGVSDNGLNCAIMLEIMDILIKSPETVRKNIIFLYNGAEEVGLLGSHAFITQHKWAASILCFVNLDACGAGGRPILFQTGPRYFKLVEIFSNAVDDAHATVIGEEIFQSGLIPSDTDFRIFRDFGNLKGLDIAHYTNGYVYHTKYDDMSRISDWTIQHAGNNLISLVYALSNSIINYNNTHAYLLSNAVYFDLFGYMICWTEYEAFTYHYITVMFSFGMIIFNLFRMKPRGSPVMYWIKHLLAVTVIIILSYISAFICCIIIHFVLAEKRITMLWFKDWSVILLLYYMPTIVIMCIPFIKYKSRMPGVRATHRHVLKFMYLIQMIWTFLLLFGTMAKIRSTYVLMFYLFPLTARGATSLVNTAAHRKDQTQIQLTCFIHFLNFIYVEYLSLQFYQLLIPITGRLGMNPEFIIGITSVFLCLLMFSLYVPLILYFDHRQVLKKIMTIIVFSAIVVVFKSSQIPFGENTPQRFTVLHCEHVNSKDVGRYNYIIYPMDFRGAETLTSLGIYESYDMKYLCGRETFCSVPVLSQPLMYLDRVMVVSTPDPVPAYEKANLTYTVDKFKLDSRTKLVKINITNQDFTNVEYVFTLHQFVKMSTWSLSSEDKLPPAIIWSGKDVFFMTRHCGLYCTDPWSFTITLQVPNRFNGSHYLKIAKCNHLTEDMTKVSDKFRQFLNKFPKWTHVSSWTSVYQYYVIN